MAQLIFAYTIGAVLVIIALFFLARPIKALFKIIISSTVGVVGLIVFNFIGGLAGLYVGINLATAVTIGILGVPGFFMILALQYILK